MTVGVTDAEFVADEQVTQMVQAIMNTPPPVLAKMRKILVQ